MRGCGGVYWSPRNDRALPLLDGNHHESQPGDRACWPPPLICSPKTGPRNMLESSHERSDNGPEFIALAVRGWLAQHQMTTVYIDPGCPWQNGYGERFNGTVRDECLNMLVLQSVAEARVVLAAYRRQYNEERPHSSLGYRTPAEFKRDWIERQS